MYLSKSFERKPCLKRQGFLSLSNEFPPYLKFQTGVHTLPYMNSIQQITVKGVKPPDINCHNGYGCVLYRWPIRFGTFLFQLAVNFCYRIHLNRFAGKRFVIITVEDIFFGRDPIKRWVDFHLILPISIYIITTIIY